MILHLNQHPTLLLSPQRPKEFGRQMIEIPANAIYEVVKSPKAICSTNAILRKDRSSSTKKCLLIDRDGTLIEHIPYLNHFSKVKFVPEIVQIVICANSNSIPVYIVSNQAGVAHGLFSESDLMTLNLQILNFLLVTHKAFVDGVLCCVSHPKPKGPAKGIVCNCRKPKPGLLLAAISECGSSPSLAGMLGDVESDIAAGLSAGLKYTWNVSKISRSRVLTEVKNWMSEGLVEPCS